MHRFRCMQQKFLCSNIRHVTEHMRISMLSASDYNKYQYIFVSILFVSAKAVFIISRTKYESFLSTHMFILWLFYSSVVCLPPLCYETVCRYQ